MVNDPKLGLWSPWTYGLWLILLSLNHEVHKFMAPTLGTTQSLVCTLKKHGCWFPLWGGWLLVSTFREHDSYSLFLGGMVVAPQFLGHSSYSPLMGGGGGGMATGPHFWGVWLMFPTSNEHDFSTSPFPHAPLLAFHTFCIIATHIALGF